MKKKEITFSRVHCDFGGYLWVGPKAYKLQMLGMQYDNETDKTFS